MCLCACLENNKWQYLEMRYMWLDGILWLWSAFSRLISLTHFFPSGKAAVTIDTWARYFATHRAKKERVVSLENRVSSSCHDMYDVQILRLYLMHSRHLVVDPGERRRDRHFLDGVLQIETAGCEQTDAQSEQNNWRNGIINLADAENR